MRIDIKDNGDEYLDGDMRMKERRTFRPHCKFRRAPAYCRQGEGEEREGTRKSREEKKGGVEGLQDCEEYFAQWRWFFPLHCRSLLDLKSLVVYRRDMVLIGEMGPFFLCCFS